MKNNSLNANFGINIHLEFVKTFKCLCTHLLCEERI